MSSTESATLKIYDTLSRKHVPFVPLDKNNIRVYACGPTVYNYAHIGNARMAVVFDQLIRVLRTLYPKVTYVSNITDVDDKIIAASKETGAPIDEITRKFETIYNEDMAVLGVTAPDIQPRATDHIGDMIKMIEDLIEKNHAYEADGHVLFNVPSYKQYGSLSGRSRDEQIAGARIEVASYKQDPADFVLWKPSQNDEPGWDSPWGYGRPGWHIECSAMSAKHLGLPFDIHGGGADLKFPHHENEIAQSCCATDHEDDPRTFAKYWMHNGFVTVEGEKMSKSLGNVQLVHDLIEQYPGEVLRLTLLSAHYRQPLDWTESALEQNRRILDRLYRALYELSDTQPGKTDAHETIRTALADDLNTPKAITVLLALKDSCGGDNSAYKGALLAGGALLGILQEDPAMWLGYGQTTEDLDAGAIEALLTERTQARKDRNFARADEIRDELAAQGIEIEDTPVGPQWKKA